MSGVLGLGPEDYRLLALALTEFATGKPSPHASDHDRDQAAALLDTLVDWGFVSAGQDRQPSP